MRLQRPLCLSLLASFVVCAALVMLAPAAEAQQIQVTSADPPSGEQGTLNLNVRILGKGFKSGAAARFYLTGTTNPDGVVVNSTTFVSTTEVIANVDIAETATISNFDVEVQNRDGRTGKGIEKFSVVAKGNKPCTDTSVRLIVAPQIIGQGGISGDGLQIYSNLADPVFDGGTVYTDGEAGVAVKLLCGVTQDFVINLNITQTPTRHLKLDFSVQLAPADTANGATDLTGMIVQQRGQQINQMNNDSLYTNGLFLTCSGASNPDLNIVTHFKDPALYEPVVPDCQNPTAAQVANQPLPTSHVTVQRVDACTWIAMSDVDSSGFWRRAGVSQTIKFRGKTQIVSAGQYHMPFAYRVEKLGCTP